MNNPTELNHACMQENKVPASCLGLKNVLTDHRPKREGEVTLRRWWGVDLDNATRRLRKGSLSIFGITAAIKSRVFECISW
jgi:hypothetical protein